MNNCAYISALAVGIFLKWTHFTETYQMKSPQCEQNVGCLRKVAMNLCELIWWTLRFMAPLLCLVTKPPS